MKSQRTVLGFFTAFVLSLGAVATPRTADLAGTWVGIFYAFPDESGDDQFILVLKKSENGYAGILNDSNGFLKKDTAITDVKADGKTISFLFVVMWENGEQTNFGMTLTLEGETLAGTIESKTKGAGQPFEFIRKK
jgi:hypothetical protein